MGRRRRRGRGKLGVENTYRVKNVTPGIQFLQPETFALLRNQAAATQIPPPRNLLPDRFSLLGNSFLVFRFELDTCVLGALSPPLPPKTPLGAAPGRKKLARPKHHARRISWVAFAIWK